MEKAFQVITGRLLKYYRENYRHSNGKIGLSIRELSRFNSGRIQEIRTENGIRLNQKSICSTSRISDIENGHDSMADYVIECLASVHERKYLYKEIYWVNLTKDIDDLIYVMERMTQEVIEKLTCRLHIKYRKLDKYLVYSEILEILLAILAYLQYHSIPKPDILRKIDVLLPTGLYPLDSLLLYMKSEYLRKIGLGKVSLSEIDLILGKSDDFLGLELRFRAYMDCYNLDLAKKTIQKIKDLPDYVSLPYLQFVYHNGMALIYENSRSGQVVQELKACEKLLTSGQLNGCLHVHGRFYHNLGMHYYAHHQFAKALDSLQHALKLNSDLVLQAFPYLMDCAERMEFDLEEKRALLCMVDFVHTSGFKLTQAKYFRLKYSYEKIERKEALLLEKFLVEDILPFIDNGLLIYDLFYRQLLALIPFTRHIQYVLQFYEK